MRRLSLRVGILVLAALAAACQPSTAEPTPASAPTVAPAPTAPAVQPATAPATTPTGVPSARATPTTSGGTSTVEVRVTDAPPDGVSSIRLTVRDVEVGAAEEYYDPVWQVVVTGPVTFDLVKVAGIEEVLGDAIVPSGSYQQVRLTVVEAKVTVDGVERPTTVPSGVLRVVGSFEVAVGQTTVLTLDFDAEKSVVLRGQKEPLLKPVVRLLARQGGRPLSQAEVVGSVEEEPSSPTPMPTAQPASTPAPGATPTPPAPTTPTAQATATEPRVMRVTALDFRFQPATIAVTAGETVVFTVTNGGNAFHTFTFQVGAISVDLALRPGQSASTGPITFAEAGQTPFWCTPHRAAGMTGVISVASG